MLDEGQVVLCLCQVEDVLNTKAESILVLNEIFSQLHRFSGQAFAWCPDCFFRFRC